jgi:hypothetical protein
MSDADKAQSPSATGALSFLPEGSLQDLGRNGVPNPQVGERIAARRGELRTAVTVPRTVPAAVRQLPKTADERRQTLPARNEKALVG